MSPRLLRRRPARVVPAVIVASLLLLISAGLGWLAVTAFAAGGGLDSPLTAGWTDLDVVRVAAAEGSVWNSWAVIGLGAVLAVFGLLVLTGGISPGPRRYSRVRAQSSEHIGRLEVGLPTATLSNLAAAAADSVDGVSSVKAAANAKSTIVTFSTPFHDHDVIRAEVEAAVTRRFASISFERTPTVRVHARRIRG